MTGRFQIAVCGLGLAAGLALLAGCSWFGVRLTDDETQGRALFLLHCADCHEGAHPDLHKQPPKLQGLFQSQTLPSGAPATDAQVRKTIIEGRGTMPAFDQRLSEKDVDDLVRYLHTLK
jgi:mono/diheme cytochrome c family protein